MPATAKRYPCQRGDRKIRFLRYMSAEYCYPWGIRKPSGTNEPFQDGNDFCWISCRQHRPLTFHPTIIDFTWVHGGRRGWNATGLYLHVWFLTSMSKHHFVLPFTSLEFSPYIINLFLESASYPWLCKHVTFLHWHIFRKHQEKM